MTGPTKPTAIHISHIRHVHVQKRSHLRALNKQTTHAACRPLISHSFGCHQVEGSQTAAAGLSNGLWPCCPELIDARQKATYNADSGKTRYAGSRGFSEKPTSASRSHNNNLSQIIVATSPPKSAKTNPSATCALKLIALSSKRDARTLCRSWSGEPRVWPVANLEPRRAVNLFRARLA